ncbi:MAG: cytochrome c maturation protein CcmE [Polyangiaceae bacterium]|nr:cytochrome c maturation protein CcmE [Polyangiaceae bacterium]
MPQDDHDAREAHTPVDDSPRGIPASAKIAAVLLVLVGGVVALVLSTNVSDAMSYSKLVHEVAADPGAFEGRQLRVEGDLQPGSIQFREEPCEWRFVLQKEGQQLPVTFPQCVVPDTFRDGVGIQVTVQGRLQDDGRFLANEVIPRCPSKYEMQERLEAGEQMPHSATSAPATL